MYTQRLCIKGEASVVSKVVHKRRQYTITTVDSACQQRTHTTYAPVQQLCTPPARAPVGLLRGQTCYCPNQCISLCELSLARHNMSCSCNNINNDSANKVNMGGHKFNYSGSLAMYSSDTSIFVEGCRWRSAPRAPYQ